MQRAVGRPTGEASTVLHVRLPLARVHRLDRSLARRATETGLQTHHGALLRQALKVFLASTGMEGTALTAPSGVFTPPVERRFSRDCPRISSCNVLKRHGLGLANSISSFCETP